jgi:hypothetical protein
MRDTIDIAQEIAAQYIKAERFQTWTHGYMMERLMELVAVSAEAEREACAKVCEELPLVEGAKQMQRATLKDAAAAIRSRGT